MNRIPSGTNLSEKLPRDVRKFPSDRGRSYDEMNNILDTLGHTRSDGTMSKTQSIDIQVTEDCNLRCTYCFQINKSKRRLKWEDAKAFIDYILTRTPENCEYTNYDKYHAITLGFVGGDPLVEIDLIDRIMTYFIERMIELDHPWLTRFAVHLDTNGVAYFDPKVQKFLKKWDNVVSCTITLDGNQELHDKCRVFPNGSGSYKYAEAAIIDQFKRGKEPSGKFTISHENIDYLYDAALNLINLGYTYILGNEVYEDVWTDDDPSRYYKQLKRLADTFLEKEYYESIRFPLLEIGRFYRMEQLLYQNHCGGNGDMLDLSADGKMYPCYRYNRTAVGPNREPLSIGDPYNGIESTEKEKRLVAKLKTMTRLSCSTIECIECPIKTACGYCNGCNYCSTGDPGIKVSFNCLMTCASYIASYYYWSKVNIKKGISERYDFLLSKDKALKIISKEEYEELLRYKVM